MISDFATAKIYTDFNGLSALKRSARDHSPEALREVANQFEAIFVNLLLKQMREASLGDGLFESDQTRFYQEMMDQQVALNISGQHTLGIADMIVKQLQSISTLNANETSARKISPVLNIQKTIRQDTNQIHDRSDSEIIIVPEFKTPEQFIDTIRPFAESSARELGIPTNILIAQSALETGWGKKIIKTGNGHSSFNLFGIKADDRWSGPSVRIGTLEYVNGTPKREFASFRSYESFGQSFNDYVEFIKNNDRYRKAVENNFDGNSYIHALQEAGYATDPRYAEKILNIVERGII